MFTGLVLLFAAELPGQVTVSGPSVTVAASAADNIGVVGVRFFLDGAALGAEDTVAPYTIAWDTTAWPDGTYMLTARARDAAGNQAVSAPIPVLVANGATPHSAVSPIGVAVVTPAAGAAVAGVQTITVTASADEAVRIVRFRVDGSRIAAASVAPYSASWDTTAHADGSATITAVAEDRAGNRTISAPVSVMVRNGSVASPQSPLSSGPSDASHPGVGVTAPADGATVAGKVVVRADAWDDIGVAGVRFLLDGMPQGAEDTVSPYSVTLDSTAVADGPHTLAARARDAAGNQTRSGTVTVVVSNPPGPDPDPDPRDAPAMENGTVSLAIGEANFQLIRQIRARAEGGHRMELYIDGQLASETSGRSMEYDWDTRPLVGSREVRAVTMEGGEVLASTSLFQAVASSRPPSVTLDLAKLGIIGATVIRARADVDDARRLQLFIDGQLRVAKDGSQVEHAFAPGAGRSYDIVFVVYDSTGVAASASVRYAP